MTNDIERLHVHENYKGNEQIQVANGTHIPILHIGESSLSGFSRPLRLSNVLHAPRISKNLLSTHKLANDNHCLIELHPEYFFVKDLTTRATLLQGRAQDGLYPEFLHSILAIHHDLRKRTPSHRPRNCGIVDSDTLQNLSSRPSFDPIN
jgi:hypothetical protein